MAVDFHQLIARNRRNSRLLILAFTLFVALLGGVLGYSGGYYHGGGPAGWAYAAVATGIALFIALIGSAGSYFGGASTILRISGARRLQQSDDPQLCNVVDEMALAAGVPPPEVYLIDDTAPNAFATGRDPRHGAIAITTGLRAKLTRDELQGVIAHEMAHIRNLDIRFALLMTTLVGVVVLLCDMYLRSMRWGAWRGMRSGGSRRGGRSEGGGGLAIVLILVGLLLAIVAPLIARIIEMAFSRQREFLADASAVELTRNPDGLASALSKVANDPEVLEVANRATAPLYFVHPIKHFEDRAGSIMDSHPPIKERIRRILSLQA